MYCGLPTSNRPCRCILIQFTCIFCSDFSPPTVMPPRNRQLVLNTIDRGDADGFYPISAAHPGRNFWLLVTLDPGTPWNRELSTYQCFISSEPKAPRELIGWYPPSPIDVRHHLQRNFPLKLLAGPRSAVGRAPDL